MNHPPVRRVVALRGVAWRVVAWGVVPITALLAHAAFARSKPSAEKGNEVFDEQCASCHHAYSSERKTGPGLKFLFAKGKLESNGKPVTDGLSVSDKADLLACLKTL